MLFCSRVTAAAPARVIAFLVPPATRTCQTRQLSLRHGHSQLILGDLMGNKTWLYSEARKSAHDMMKVKSASLNGCCPSSRPVDHPA
jgi:hypothetical protein